MQIWTEQMHELGRACAESFADRVTAFVRAELRGEAGAVTREVVVALIDRARGHGFTLQSTIVAFVIAARLLGHDFDERLPAARAILEDPKAEELRAFELESLTVSLLAPPVSEEASP